MYSTRVRSFGSTSGTCRVTLVTNAVINHAWGKDRAVLMKSETSVVNESYSKNSQLGLAVRVIYNRYTQHTAVFTENSWDPPHLLRLALPKDHKHLISTDDAKWSFASPIVAQQAYTHSRCFFPDFIVYNYSIFNIQQ
jgi:hypothetical protein